MFQKIGQKNLKNVKVAKLMLRIIFFNFQDVLNFIIYEPGHEKMCLMSYANNKGADQTVRMRTTKAQISLHIRAV